MKVHVRRAATRVAVLVFVVFAVTSPALAVTKTWTNNNGLGDQKWGTATNWSPAGVPTSADDVEIGVTDQTSNYLSIEAAATANSVTIGNVFTNNPVIEIKFGNTLTIAAASNIAAGATLRLNYGNVTGAGNLLVSGTLDVNGGQLSGPGTITVDLGGVINFSATSNYTYLSRDTTNNGTINYLSSPSYDHYFYTSAVVTNNGVFDLQGDETIWISNGAASAFRIDNQAGAIVKKSAGAGNGTFRAALNNASGASVQALSGTLTLDGGGTSAGDFQAPAGNVVNIATATYTFGSGATFTGAGKITVSSTLTLSGAADVTVANLQLVNNSSKVDGTGTLRITTLLQWDGGYQSGAGMTIITSGATMNVACSTGPCYLDTRQLNVATGATANYTGSTGSWYFYNAASFNLGSTATLNIQTDQDFLYGGGTASSIDNGGGTIQKTSGSAATVIGVPLTSSGTISVSSGDLQFSSGATISAGSINVGTSSNFDITGGIFTFAAAATVSGTGNFRVTGGTLRVPTGVTQVIPQFALLSSAGYVDGAGTLQLSGTATWSAGSMGSSAATQGTTEVASGATLNITAATSYAYLDYDRTLLNNGTIYYSAATYSLYLSNQADIVNNGAFDISTDVGVNITGSAPRLFTNNGTLTKSAGTSATGAPMAAQFDNAASGTVTVTSGRLNLSGGGTSSGTFDVGLGTYIQVANLYSFAGTPAVTGSGTIRVYSGGNLVVPTGVTLTIQNLAFDAGYISGGGTLRIASSGTWSAGTMGHPTYPNGTTEVMLSASLTIDGAASYAYLDQGRTLLNNNVINYTTPTYPLYMYSGTTLNNAGTINYSTDAGIGISGSGMVLANSGTILKNSGAGSATISVPVNNSGTIQADSGSLFLGGGGTHNGGTFNANGATLGFSNGTHTLDGTTTVTGTGTIVVSGGAVTTAGTYSPANLTVNSGTLTLNSNGSAGVLLLTSSGTINGSGTLTLTDNSTWAGGTMSGIGTTVVNTGKTLTITATTNYCYLDTRTLTNNGTIQYPPSTANYYVYIYNNGVLNNAGTFEITNDQYVYGQTTGTINNSGTFTKTAGSGNTVVHPLFNNTGTVSAISGTLSLNAGGNHTGAFTPTSPAAVAFSGGTHTLSAASTITGTGTLGFTGAAVTSSAAYSVGTLKVTAGSAAMNANGSADTLDFSGGILGGSGALTLNAGGTWTGGTMSGTGSTTVPAGQTLAITPSTNYIGLEGGRTLTNNGTINYTTGPYYLQIYNNGVLNNAGVFNQLTDQSLYGYSNGVFNNSGSFNRTSGTGNAAVSVAFNNTGSVSVTTGTLTFSGAGTHTGTWTVTSPATLAFSGSVHTATAGSFGGTGTLAFTGATATFATPYTVGTLLMSAGTATLDGSGSADAFTQSGGILGGSGTLTLNNGGSWTAGTMSGTGSTIVPALQTLNISASAGYPSLDGRTLNNSGTINYTAALYYMQIFNNAVLNNSGTFNYQSDQALYGYSNGVFNNTGTLNRTSGTGTATMSVILNNSGQVSNSAGVLSLTGGGTHTNGVFTATAPGTLQFGGGTHTLSGTGSLGGSGGYSVTGGTTTVGVPYAMASLSMTGGQIDFNTTGSVGILTLTGGTLAGSGTVTVTDNGTWNGGGMSGSGTTVFSAGKTYTVGGSSYCSLDTRTLTNNGTINYVASTAYLQIYNGAVLNNAGTLSLQTDNYLYGFSAATINNTGVISRTSGSSNATQIYAAVNNDGSITATVGTIELVGGGTHNGTFTATSPAAIAFNGTHTVNAPGTLGGTGRYRFVGGTTTVGGTWSGIAIDITSGTLNLNTNGSASVLNMTTGSAILGGTGNVTVLGNSSWSGGTMQGTGTTTFDTAATITIDGVGYSTLARPLSNLGTIVYTAPTAYLSINGATLTNDGTFDVQTDTLIYAYGTSPLWQNNGTLRKTAGTGSMQFYAPLSNAGIVQVGSGTMVFSNTYTQSAGTTELLNNATLQTTTLDLNGGTLMGNGTVSGAVISDGIVGPGASAGTLTITGNYTQNATGSLDIELGGTTQGTQYDQLVVQGSVTLAGTLNVTLINGFFPASGNTFQIMTFASRPGSTDFATKNGLNLGSGTNLIDAYSATDLQLTTNSVQADLAIAMTAAPATVNNGSAFAWNVTVTNNGGSNASGVAVSATLPANAVFTGSTPAICTGAPNLVCSVGTLPNGGTATFSINATANGTGTASTTASVAGSQFDPNGLNNSATAGVTIAGNADLGVSVTDGPDPVAAGAVVTYTITVNNAGFDGATGVTLSTTPSAELTFNSASAPCASGFPCSLGNLGSGATSVVTASYTVAPTATGIAQLQAAVSAASPADPNAADNTATQTTTIVQNADVQVVKTGPTNVPPEAGSTVTYNIAVTNNGPSAASAVSLDDPTPAGLTLQSVSGACTAFPCSIGTLTVAQTASVQVVYQISGAVGTTFTNTATITSAADTNASNDQSSVTTTISNCPAVTITAPPSVDGGSTGNAASVTNIAGATYNWSITNGTITAGATSSTITFTAGASGVVTLSVTVTSGACVSNPAATVPIVSADLVVTKTGPANVSPTTASTVTYTIDVTNNGPSSASGVTLADPTPFGLTFVSATGACTAFPCSLGTMVAAQSASVQATYSFAGGAQQTVTNTATVSSASSDPASANNTASASTVIAACPAIAISGPTAMEPNTSSTATATVVNNATYSWTIANGTITGGQGTEAITFTAGSAGTTTLSVSVTAGQCSGSASLSIPVTSTQADVGISKASAASVASGSQFVYTLTVTNNGPANADAVTVSDSLPGSVTFVSVDSPLCTGGSVVTCNLGTLASGSTTTIAITVTAPQGPVTLTNTAQVSTTSADPNPVNNSSSITTSVSAPAVSCPGFAPTLFFPADGASSLTSPVTFSWSAVPNATTYELWLGPDAGSLTLSETTPGTSLDVTLPSGTYAWQVVAKGDLSCNGFASTTRTFTIPPLDTCAGHGAPALVSPVGGTVASPVTFDWDGVADAAGYVVLAGVNGGPLEPLGSTGADVTTLTAAVPSGTIVWAVEAIFSNCPSVASAHATFLVPQLGTCEGTAQPLEPGNGGSTADASIDFSWTAISSASGYRLWLQTGTAVPEVIGTTLGTSLTKTVPAGTHTWWVETLFEGCPSHESAHFSFTVLPAQNCDERGRPSLESPSNGATTSTATVTFSWSAVANAIEYELHIALNGGVPTLVGTTNGTSYTTEVPAGTLEWYVRAIFSGCAPTESDPRTITYTPPPNCALNTRPVLIAPAEGERVASPAAFDWNDVANATGYELYVDDQLVATTTASQATVQRPLGAGKWLVRAKFAQTCSPLDSTESRFVVVPQAAACSPLDAPVVSAPGQISSRVQALLQWSFVAGATSYTLQVSSDPSFGTGTETSDTGEARQAHFSLENGGTEPLTRYIRVRANDTRCNPPSEGPWSAAAILYVLPESGDEGSTLISDPADIEYFLPLAAELAGQTFSATPTASWITVTPNNGTVPPGGMFLTVVAHTRGLPPGTSVGGVTVAIGTAGSRISTHGSGTTTPITVNLVSPVTPTPKTTPPPDALVIPAVANADGIGSHFQSDIRVSNTSAQVMKYQLSYIPSGEAGITNGRQTTFSVEPGRTVALDDILKTWFGTGPSNAIGTLEVRPLTEVAKSTTAAPVGALANIVTFASSRTFNATPNGTFGQYIPAIPFANFIGKAAGGVPSVLSLQQISQSAKYRTNLGLVEGSGQPASLLVKVFGSTGVKLTEFPVQLNGGQHTQLNGFLAQQGITSLDDGRVEVEVTGGGGKVTAYASVLDNETSDPLLVSPVALTESGNTKWVMPGVADLNNGAANWQTDMRVFNAGTTPEELTLTFYSMNGGEPKTTAVTLQPGEVRQFDRILLNTFGVTQNGGAVHISSADSARLIATSRTYNLTTHGTYGQFISAVTPAEAAAVGSRPLQLLQVEESPRYRSNIGFAEVTGKPVTLEVSIVPPDAKFTATVNVTLAPNEFRQINSMLAGLGLGDTYNARISVRAVGGEGRATAYASVIDLQTQDPTLVPAQ